MGWARKDGRRGSLLLLRTSSSGCLCFQLRHRESAHLFRQQLYQLFSLQIAYGGALGVTIWWIIESSGERGFGVVGNAECGNALLRRDRDSWIRSTESLCRPSSRLHRPRLLTLLASMSFIRCLLALLTSMACIRFLLAATVAANLSILCSLCIIHDWSKK